MPQETAEPSVEAAFQAARHTLALAREPRTCRRCEREGRDAVVDDASLDRCPRCKSTLRFNSLAVTRGLRRRPELHPDSARDFLDRVGQVLRDSGEGDDPPAVRASQTRDFVRLELLIETAFNAIADRGASPKVIDQLVTLIATKARLAAQLGLARRSRPVRSLADVLAEHEDAEDV
jgi:hypothetical protein